MDHPILHCWCKKHSTPLKWYHLQSPHPLVSQIFCDQSYHPQSKNPTMSPPQKHQHQSTAKPAPPAKVIKGPILTNTRTQHMGPRCPVCRPPAPRSGSQRSARAERRRCVGWEVPAPKAMLRRPWIHWKGNWRLIRLPFKAQKWGEKTGRLIHSGQVGIIFHQPRFHWNSLEFPYNSQPFGPIVWPDPWVFFGEKNYDAILPMGKVWWA